MKSILKMRWLLIALWLVLTVVFVLNQPDLKQILNEKGETHLSKNEPSQVAQAMINKMADSKGDNLLFVFSSDVTLTDAELKNIQSGLDNMRSQTDTLKLVKVMDPFSTPEAADQMISADGTTVIVSVNYERGTRDGATMISSFQNALKDVTVDHYITGELAIITDYLRVSNAGVEKSGIITVIFILIVLIFMFRSIVTPLVSLFAVAIAYVTSMGIIGILIDTVNFPITSLTQMFIILVLFGIGTDYNILLFNRFKEELGHGLSVNDAVIATYRSAGKTVFFSGLTVFMAFASLSFVQFAIYRSANAVAIGIVVLLIELLTLTPVLMHLFARNLFWPSKQTAGKAAHKESKLWERVSSTSVKHPLVSLGVVFAILIPVMLLGNSKLSFDSLKDLSADTPSVKGFNIVAEKFGTGKAMPTTLVIENTSAMNTNEALQVLDRLSTKLKGLEGIAQVSGPTQPKGDPIEQFYTQSQTQSLVEGLTSAQDGLTQVHDGLALMNEKMTVPDFSQVDALASGTGDIADGLSAVNAGLTKLSAGTSSAASGATDLATGITGVKGGIAKLHAGALTLSTNLKALSGGYTQLQAGYTSMPASITGLNQLVGMMQGTVQTLVTRYPGDVDILTLQGQLTKLSQSLTGLSAGLTTANTNYATLTSGLAALTVGFDGIVAGTSDSSDLVLGLAKLEAGASALSTGLQKGSAGQKQISDSLVLLEEGTRQLQTGQEALVAGLAPMASGLSDLKDGLTKSADGLTQVTTGLDSAKTFMSQMATAKTFYMPEEAFASADVTKMFDAYMSSDRKVAKITLNLTANPYAPESLNVIDEINTLVASEFKGTTLSDAKFGIVGPTAITYDLNKIATHDIQFTQIIVLAAIFILLVLIIRSLVIPAYIIGALLTAYYVAISVTAFLTSQLFPGMDGMSWNVPFFSFVVIAALGVDYSIFLMMRFKEYPEMEAKEAIVMASKHIGGVVMSAAVILAGTFATLYPSNLHVMMELAICVVTGLVLLSLILLPIVLPALISVTDMVGKKLNKAHMHL